MHEPKSVLDPMFTDGVRPPAMPRRPQKPETKPEQRRNVWLSQVQLQKIMDLAEQEDRSFSSMIRRLVQAGLDVYDIRGKK